MPYIGKWVPAVAALAHVIRVDQCDRLTATRQIETAARDGALRWFHRRNTHWSWEAEVSREDLLKLWPAPPASADTSSDVRVDLETAAAWHSLPLPTSAELQRLRVGFVDLKDKVTDAIRSREAAGVPADVVGDKIDQAKKDVEGQLLARLARGELACFIETNFGVKRLPYEGYWINADGSATTAAQRALCLGGCNRALRFSPLGHSDGQNR